MEDEISSTSYLVAARNSSQRGDPLVCVTLSTVLKGHGSLTMPGFAESLAHGRLAMLSIAHFRYSTSIAPSHRQILTSIHSHNSNAAALAFFVSQCSRLR